MKTLINLSIFTFLFNSYSYSQNSANTFFHIDKIPTEGILLDKGWKFHVGDDLEWAKFDFDDKSCNILIPL